MNDILGLLGPIGAIYGTAAFTTQLIVGGFTMAWPTRPSWAAWLAAQIAGVLLTTLVGLAVLGTALITGIQPIAQTVLLGLLAGASAGGARDALRSADEKRTQARSRAARSASAAPRRVPVRARKVVIPPVPPADDPPLWRSTRSKIRVTDSPRASGTDAPPPEDA